ncbi:NAD(P)-dependent alcohol dehydrogenase [Mucilaginibacter segetis]|uniref:NAD(P)-dependent alcohol dehydrogenase n=1 Tax=Mucilaginibacter segetis TaxID=2793071 RepID=A0A934PTJ3_9SPHI|nr:NAD(P)-dependent alcohol dehydrogenase [Mucilaginibacter segetis]MBK0379287.1 NAD(P)-dependent alcohol dehydrogenase [Mucilaginibacter segetis]
MKKIIYHRFGDAEVLEMADVAMPAVSETTVLIKVKAVSINPLDWKIRNGEMKLMSGSKFPRGIGIDFSGIVEAVGSTIKAYKKGDEVFGLLDVFKGAALADYILADEQDIAAKPKGASFEQAAAAPVVGSAAIQLFDTLVNIQAGTEVLINGASGGIGMFAIQIAKKKGAAVTAVVSDNGLEAAEDWGSDVVINYRNEDVLQAGKLYDAVIDLSNQLPYSAAKKIMKASSVYVHTAPGPKEIISSFFISLFSAKKYKVLMLKPSPVYLKALKSYMEAGLSVVVSRVYSFDAFKTAYTEAPRAHIVGKSVIRVN